MQYKKISDLKKEAKKERKNNPSLKNHSDSLNLIALKYGKNKWEDLLDSSVILLDEPKETVKRVRRVNLKTADERQLEIIKIVKRDIYEPLSKIIDNRNCIMLSNDYKEISNFLLDSLIKDKKDNDFIESHIRHFINLIAFLYTKRKNKDQIDFDYLIKLFDYSALINEINDYRKEPIVTVFFRYFMSAKSIENQNQFSEMSQFNFITSTIYNEMEKIKEQFDVFPNKDYLNFVNAFAELKNIRILEDILLNQDLDAENNLNGYKISLSKKLQMSFYDIPIHRARSISIYNENFIKNHQLIIDLLLEY